MDKSKLDWVTISAFYVLFALLVGLWAVLFDIVWGLQPLERMFTMIIVVFAIPALSYVTLFYKPETVRKVNPSEDETGVFI